MNTHCCYKSDFYKIDLFCCFKANKRPAEFISASHKVNSYGKSGCETELNSLMDSIPYFSVIFFLDEI
ncbi:hypothetical protein [Tenacibaculum finnmarkense]|uniref:hypothetical protein n=1 Tax=Tenacibaculum finnmarkense TaxID=2781243 RepID=UPI001EFABD52|nr:hypothetical protein [Tenacibaculum finnmarkense]MCM8906480.1 hypothetical protein [Tenacibaculum finnmarkense genomovar finnmarkense]